VRLDRARHVDRLAIALAKIDPGLRHQPERERLSLRERGRHDTSITRSARREEDLHELNCGFAAFDGAGTAAALALRATTSQLGHDYACLVVGEDGVRAFGT